MSNPNNLMFGIAMNLDLTPMGDENVFFSSTSNAMFQVFAAVKLGNLHPSDAHQSATFIEELARGLHIDWMAHATPSGYIDHDGCMKATIHFRTASGAAEWNCQVLFFGKNRSHYDANLFDIVACNFINPFTLKEGERKIYQPNDNGPNAALKAV